MLALFARVTSGLTPKLIAPIAALILAGSAPASIAQSGSKFVEPDEIDMAGLIFSTMDVNFSGLLTEAEMAFYYSYVFLSMDNNDNGRVDDEEFFLNYSAIMPVPLEELEQGEKILEAEFAAYDSDQDGSVTQQEMVARYGQSFAALDSDNSGALTLEEFANHDMATAFAQFEQQRPGMLSSQ